MSKLMIFTVLCVPYNTEKFTEANEYVHSVTIYPNQNIKKKDTKSICK